MEKISILKKMDSHWAAGPAVMNSFNSPSLQLPEDMEMFQKFLCQQKKFRWEPFTWNDKVFNWAIKRKILLIETSLAQIEKRIYRIW